jgi:CspA family cold shock protein
MSDGRRHTGTVKWFNSDKGYGFVDVDGRDGDVFLGRGAIERGDIPEPEPGDRLSFVIGVDRQNRPRAEQLARIWDDADAERLFPPARP